MSTHESGWASENKNCANGANLALKMKANRQQQGNRAIFRSGQKYHRKLTKKLRGGYKRPTRGEKIKTRNPQTLHDWLSIFKQILKTPENWGFWKREELTTLSSTQHNHYLYIIFQYFLICMGFLFLLLFFFCCLEPHLQLMWVPRPGVESDSMSEARNWICILVDTSQSRCHCATMVTPSYA